MRRPRTPLSLLRAAGLSVLTAALIMTAGCRNDSVTGLRIVTSWSGIEVDQLEFQVLDGMATPLVGNRRPMEGGEPLASGADVLIYFDEARDGQEMRCTVIGRRNKNVVGAATEMAVIVAQQLAEVSITLKARTGNTPNGEECTDSGDCTSGICADGVCCAGPCTGTCVACNVPNKLGVCSSVPAGRRHRACADNGAATCGTDGTCDGAGSCRKYAAGTSCGAGMCTGSTITASGTCDGAGQCTVGPVVTCAPYGCNPAARPVACFSSCTSSTQCAGGRACVAGSCGSKDNGAACLAGTECTSGVCVDGVCCESACTGPCLSCALPGLAGRCRAVAAGNPDPRKICKTEAASTCGQNGSCDGTGSCQRHPSGTVCKAGVCMSATVAVTPSRCDGGGRCVAGGPIGCAPYACGPSGACNNVCLNNSDCVVDRACNMTTRSCGQKPLGGLCSSGADCESTHCVDGVCCNEACAGACRTCSLGTTPGLCTMVPPDVDDPRNVCRDDGASKCGTDGKCNGMGGCQKYAAGTECAAGSCTAGSRTLPGQCDTTGRCVPGGQASCGNYQCNGNTCFTSCDTDANCAMNTFCMTDACSPRGSGAPCSATAPCAAPFSCIGSTCQLKPNGQPCTAGNQCMNGMCTEGVCCNMSDCGRCRSCKVAGSVGFCQNVAAGTLDGRCTKAAVATCGQDGTCNGAGGCRLYPSGTECAAPSCSGRVRANPKTCDGGGMCKDNGTTDCAPYVCNTAVNACFTSCDNDSQCVRRCRSDTCSGF